MFITQQLAQSIVNQIKNTIHQEINFMDIDSIIIASTNPERIDDFHEGSQVAIESNEMIFVTEDDQFEGTKKGINMPIRFNNQIIGVLGISGEVSEVIQFGEIIKKMTEILIMEQSLQDIHTINTERARLIINEILLLNDSEPSNSVTTILGYSLTEKHRGIYCESESSLSAEDQYTIDSKINHYFANESKLIPKQFDDKKIHFITTITDRTKLEKKVASFLDDIIQQLPTKIQLGIGTVANNAHDIKDSFTNAENVIRWNELNRSDFSFFEDIELGIIITALDRNIQEYYKDQILSEIPKDKLAKYKNILTTYERNNRSINACAKELYMHRNTFQYQLNKIYEHTGYNPIVLSDFVILKIAFSLVNLQPAE